MMMPNQYNSKEIQELMSNKEPEKAPTPSEKGVDLLKEGANCWSKINRKYLESYDKGEVIANYNSVSEYDYLTLFLSLIRILKDTTREQLIESENDTKNINEFFNIIEMSFRLLASQINENTNSEPNPDGASKEEFDVDVLFSAIHGFMNAYASRRVKLD